MVKALFKNTNPFRMTVALSRFENIHFRILQALLCIRHGCHKEFQTVALTKRLAIVTALLLYSTLCYSDDRKAMENVLSESGLAYDLVGEGRLVVLIHGTNLDRRMWEGEVAWLREHASVLRYDLRGQGTSDFPTEAYSNHSDLIELLDELGEREVDIVGLSAGAQVALDVALEAPDRVRRLILVSPSLMGYVPKEMPPYLADLMGALRARDFNRASDLLLASSIMQVPPKHSKQVRTMVEDNERLWTIPYSLVKQVSPSALERLEEIKITTLVLVGQHDVEAIRAQGELLERRLANARQVIIADGGHLLNMTSPDSFRKEVSIFLGFSQN